MLVGYKATVLSNYFWAKMFPVPKIKWRQLKYQQLEVLEQLNHLKCLKHQTFVQQFFKKNKILFVQDLMPKKSSLPLFLFACSHQSVVIQNGLLSLKKLPMTSNLLCLLLRFFLFVFL